MKSKIDSKAALKGGLLLLVLASAWILPPAVHKTLHYCPVRPDGVSQAEAVPAFARKYGFSCMQCHSNWPTLNDYGRQFKMNGYVPSRDSEEGVLKTKDAAMWIEKNFPVSAVVVSQPFEQNRHFSGSGSADQEFTLQAIQSVNVFVAGGDAARHVSWFGEANAENGGGFAVTGGDFALGYHPSEYFNLVAARRGFFVADPYQTLTNFGSPTIADRAVAGVQVADLPPSMYTMDQSAQSVYAFGEVGKDEVGYLYYAAGVQADPNNDAGTGGKSFNGRLAFDTMKGVVLGAFGGAGHSGSAYYGSGAQPDVVDRVAFNRSGVDLLVEKGPVTARAAAMYAHDYDTADNANLTNAKETNRAAYVEAQYSYRRGDSKVPFLVPLVRENWYTTGNGTHQFAYLTAQLAHYFAANVKGLVEASWDTKQDIVASADPNVRQPKGNRVTAQVQIGF